MKRLFVAFAICCVCLLCGCSGVSAFNKLDELTKQAGEIALAENTQIAQMAKEWTTVENSMFETKYDKGLKNRTINLEVASKTVDGLVLQPGEVFSFNKVVGLATKEKGYKEAKIFLKGEEVMGLGGGICQLSSAIYNSADQAGLEIVERHAHSMKVHYVPEGRDAATAYGGVDLKFKNTKKEPVRLRAQMDDGVLKTWMESSI